MKKIKTGILLGAIAGIIDLIPMIMQNLTWDANLSAFSMWVIIGFFISITDLKLKPAFKGILISFLVLLPNCFLIGWKEPISLIPIFTITLILGAVLGHLIQKCNLEKN